MPLVEQRLWQKLISNRGDKVLVTALQEVYGIKVDGLTYTPFLGTPSLLLLLADHSVRLDDFGDGTRYFLRLLMLLSHLEDAVLLIEEPETAHHFSALKQVAETVAKMSRDRRLQVFATTHSSEAIRCFAEACQAEKVGFALVHTQLHNGVLTARSAGAHDTEVLMDMGIDPRLAADK